MLLIRNEINAWYETAIELDENIKPIKIYKINTALCLWGSWTRVKAMWVFLAGKRCKPIRLLTRHRVARDCNQHDAKSRKKPHIYWCGLPERHTDDRCNLFRSSESQRASWMLWCDQAVSCCRTNEIWLWNFQTLTKLLTFNCRAWF